MNFWNFTVVKNGVVFDSGSLCALTENDAYKVVREDYQRFMRMWDRFHIEITFKEGF